MYGFGISGFRSFGPEPQYIAPLGKINVFVGQNNVGKSNVLRALRWIPNSLKLRNGVALPSSDDLHLGSRKADMQVLLPVKLEDAALTDYAKRVLNATELNGTVKSLRNILRALPIQAQGATWFSKRYPGGDNPVMHPTVDQVRIDRDPRSGNETAADVPAKEWHDVWSKLTAQGSGSLAKHWIPELIPKISPFQRTAIPDIHTVEPFRQIGAPGSQYEGLNGIGLIARLEELQSPERERWEDREKFQAILGFLRDVTGCSDAMLHIPHSAKQLNVTMGRKLLPIEALGTGIHQVIIFAAAATAYDGVFMCFEEPEIHMHPRLQKRLLSYLKQTRNTYFITTHSPHFLDDDEVAKFHVTLNEHGETVVQYLNTPSGRASVCFDLGYRPSDLLQANCVVWVEGPSDRVYLNAWIRAADATLREGEHYSIMFYGGRLLSHLTVSDADVVDFIELQKLNRRVAILIDSDKRSRGAEINSTKARVRDETAAHGGFAWVTAGREVENYISPGVMTSALTATHPTIDFKAPRSEWSCAYERTTGKTEGVDKIRVARAAVVAVDLDRLDLRDRVTELVEFIRRSNH